MESDLARALTHTLTSSRLRLVDRQRATSILAAGCGAIFSWPAGPPVVIREAEPIAEGRRRWQGGGMIGRRHHVVIDCPGPRALAEFYSELLGLSITYESDDWVVIVENDHTSGFAFQFAPDHRPPAWPDPSRPQQFHIDVMVEDPDAADA